LAVLLLIAALALVFVFGAIYQAAGRARDARLYPPTGRLIDIGETQLHLVEAGSGTPAVVLEAGIAASSLSWTLVLPEVAKFARVASYDRAGLGWSEPVHEPRSLERSTRELHGLLHAASIPSPYILAGHSYGGLLVRAYAAQYPRDVAGLVLVDPVSIKAWSAATDAQMRTLRRGVALSRRGALLARFGVVRLALTLLLSGASRFPKWIAKAASGRGESVASRLVAEVRKLPPQCWPMVRSHWCDPKCFLGMAAHLESLPSNAAALVKMRELPPAPLVILSAASATPGELEERDALAQMTRGAHVVASGSGHWIQFDEPRLVIDAIRGIAERVRAGSGKPLIGT
jgi:pimeloyl-ACP methyl ester carboxylesterase